MLNIFSKKDRMTMRSNVWNIGFVTDDVADVIKQDRLDIQWLKHDYKDRWFADPYFLEVTESRVIVLVEEFCYKVGRGRIARLAISRPDFVLQDMKIILELPTHLSFPVVYEKEGEVYVMPENSKSGSTNIYRYNRETECLEFLHEVACLPLTDATIVRWNDGEEYVFSTRIPTQNGDELQIYPFDGKTLRMDDKTISCVKFPSNIARNAGDAFRMGGQVFRPAQDCNKCYGNGVYIQKVEKKGDSFAFEDVRAFHSDSPVYTLGYHTFNVKKDLIVVDGHRYRFPRLVKLLGIIAKLR